MSPDSLRHEIRGFMFNLGYLPGGDKAFTTRAESTVKALQTALRWLAPGGFISILAYRGHEGGPRRPARWRRGCAPCLRRNTSCCAATCPTPPTTRRCCTWPGRKEQGLVVSAHNLATLVPGLSSQEMTVRKLSARDVGRMPKDEQGYSLLPLGH